MVSIFWRWGSRNRDCLWTQKKKRNCFKTKNSKKLFFTKFPVRWPVTLFCSLVLLLQKKKCFILHFCKKRLFSFSHHFCFLLLLRRRIWKTFSTPTLKHVILFQNKVNRQFCVGVTEVQSSSWTWGWGQGFCDDSAKKEILQNWVTSFMEDPLRTRCYFKNSL